MSYRNHSPLRRRSHSNRRWVPYTAIGLAGLACILGLAVERWLPPGSDEIFLAAVATSAFVGGVKSGLITLTLSAVLRFYRPGYSIDGSGHLALYVLLFLAPGILVCWIVGRLQP